MLESGGGVAGSSGGYAKGEGVRVDEEAMMPVSSGVPGENSEVPLDEHGLLLKETEGIEINPGRR
jgi:hypothetical protein